MNGAMINSLVSKGYDVVVTCSGNNDRSKAVLRFYVQNERLNSYYHITKFQAIKHLSSSQKGNLALFEEIKGLMSSDVQFSKRIDNSQEIKRRCKDDIRFYTAYCAIKQMDLTYL